MDQPRVGVGVFIVKDGHVLMGKRLGAHGSGHWACPGGHLEYGEDIESCAAREVLEETGLTIKKFHRIGFSNDIFHEDQKHYVTLFLVGEWEDGEPERKEPEKCLEWKWVKWGAFPAPLFLPIKHMIKSGLSPLDVVSDKTNRQPSRRGK